MEMHPHIHSKHYHKELAVSLASLQVFEINQILLLREVDPVPACIWPKAEKHLKRPPVMANMIFEIQ